MTTACETITDFMFYFIPLHVANVAADLVTDAVLRTTLRAPHAPWQRPPPPSIATTSSTAQGRPVRTRSTTSRSDALSPARYCEPLRCIQTFCIIPQDIEALLPKPFWRVENGYCLPLDSSSMPELSQLLAHSEELSASVSRALRVGVQWDTQVGSSDMAEASQRVCQVFCSALPVSYCRVTRNLDDWERFATIVLTSA